MSQHHLEIERKYELEDLHAGLPAIPWEELDGFSLREPVLEEMDATYFDTDSQALSKARVAVRRRVGGYDEGWHIKFDDNDGRRHEVHFGLLEQKKTQPAELGVYLCGVTGGEDLVETVSLATRRVRTVVLDSAGEPLGEICQDSVRAFNFADGQERVWQEWEVELLNPDSAEAESLFEQCEYLLAEAGIQPSKSAAKIARALGQDADFEIRRGVLPVKSEKQVQVEAKDVVDRLLAVALKNFSLADLKMRGSTNGSIDEFRLAVECLLSVARFAVEPYVTEKSSLDSFYSAIKELQQEISSVTFSQHAREQIEETEQQGGAYLAESLADLQSASEANYQQAAQKLRGFLHGTAYSDLVGKLRSIIQLAEHHAEFPHGPEEYFNEVNERIRESLCSFLGASAAEVTGDFIAVVIESCRFYELLQVSSATWTTGQLELRAMVADIARRAQEIDEERSFQGWCQEVSAGNAAEVSLALGFVWGKSSYYESGLALGFVGFAQHELELMQKLKLS